MLIHTIAHLQVSLVYTCYEMGLPADTIRSYRNRSSDVIRGYQIKKNIKMWKLELHCAVYHLSFVRIAMLYTCIYIYITLQARNDHGLFLLWDPYLRLLRWLPIILYACGNLPLSYLYVYVASNSVLHVQKHGVWVRLNLFNGAEKSERDFTAFPYLIYNLDFLVLK